MFISCPHCRELVATDPQTRLPPAMCPRCGGDLQEPTETAPDIEEAAPSGKRSFASFLQPEPLAAFDEPPSDTATVTATAEQAGDADITAENVDASEEVAALVVQEVALEEIEALTAEAGNATDEVTLIESPSTTDTGIDESPSAHALPRFTRTTAANTTDRPIGKWQFALVAALGLLLGLQILIADRERLAADEDWRPLITRLCGVVGCSVPTWHQPGAFSMLNRDVRPVADLPGALEAQATFRNDAAWPQAWPLLLLSLSDADGRVVGTRQFTPAEYLGKDIPKAGLAPGQSAQVSFRLREPDAGVVAFSFDFR